MNRYEAQSPPLEDQPETSVLVVEDELAVVQQITRVITRAGCRVDAALTPQEASAKLRGNRYGVVFYDLKLSPDAGGEFLAELRRRSPITAVVILHGMAPLVAAQTLTDRDFDHLPKPFSAEELIAALNRARLLHSILASHQRADPGEPLEEFGELIGHSPAMRAMFGLLSRVAVTGATVLLSGKMGTGKILAARAIHRLSPRRNKPFIWFESSKIPPSEILPRLFGGRQTDGALMTGAFTEVGDGTLYIDEITALDSPTQLKLLQAMQTRSYTPEGVSAPLTVSCRFIWGTERDLLVAASAPEAVAELYRKVSVFPIYLPTLAERSEDIPALIRQFIARAARQFAKPEPGVDDRLLTRLIARPWPGNVRELAQCVERMVEVWQAGALTLDHYLEVIEDGGISRWSGRVPFNVEELKEVRRQLKRTAVAEVERAFILEALKRNGGNVTRAAREVGIQRRNFQTMMREHNIHAG